MVVGNVSTITVALGLLLAYPILKAIYNVYLHPLSKVPGPWIWSASRLPYIRSLLAGQLIHDIEKLHKRYGSVVRIAPNEVTFANVEAWRKIYQGRPDHQTYLKDPVWWAPQQDEPTSLFNAIDVDRHARMRKIVAPAFTARAIKAQETIIQRYVNLLVERLEEQVTKEGETVVVDVSPWFNFTTFDIFGDLGFGESFNCLENSQYHPWISLLFQYVVGATYAASARFYPVIEFILMKLMPPSLKKAQKDHYKQILDKVQRRFNWELQRPDIMSHVIENEQTGKKGFTLDEINATFHGMTIAGSETTATTLCGAMTYLVADETKLRTLEKELRDTFGTREQMYLEALQNLPYLNAVLREALRLCPAVPYMLPRRIPKGGDTVCGYWLPEGMCVSIQAWTMNRDSTYFHRALDFNPERWLPEASTNEKSPYFHHQRQNIQPFSIGARNCLGQNLAWAEMRTILAKLVYTFDFGATEGMTRWQDLRTYLLVEKKPIDVKMSLRVT
ncbi:cytochrome P450 [Lophiotrema nucula]|uniref:Cytochrome P450 n=1 Tax=Lophiotrema nucula TaxID=690887 RepID=A0A6A5Z1I9_9PLEO|nr:cytochrome P450 [Lophiotrema nucula]